MKNGMDKSEVDKYIQKNMPMVMKNLERAYQERIKMEQQLQKIIDKTELEIGERDVKVIGNGCYVLIPLKYKGRRRVEILLLKKEEECSNG